MLCHQSKQRIYASTQGGMACRGIFCPSLLTSLIILRQDGYDRLASRCICVDLTLDSSTTSNVGLPLHNFGASSREPMIVRLVRHMLLLYMESLHPHKRLPCWAPFFLHAAFIHVVLLCVSISCPQPRFSTLPQGSLPSLFVYISSGHTVSLHFCFTLNRSCRPAGNSLAWAVHSCLTYLVGCESPLNANQPDTCHLDTCPPPLPIKYTISGWRAVEWLMGRQTPGSSGERCTREASLQ